MSIKYRFLDKIPYSFLYFWLWVFNKFVIILFFVLLLAVTFLVEFRRDEVGCA